MTFAEKLRELRDRAGLSEAALARKSGVAFGALHFYALGKRKPSFAAAVKLAGALGVSCEAFADCDDVRGGEPEEPEPPALAPKRGRPPKPKAEAGDVKPKRPRGRPHKGQ
jgi:transcriptional regulator with XRE-family HTH domain